MISDGIAKLYRIPFPWDYHGVAAIYVAAIDPELALVKAKAQWDARKKELIVNDYSGSFEPEKVQRGYGKRIPTPQWSKIAEVESSVFFANGCND